MVDEARERDDVNVLLVTGAGRAFRGGAISSAWAGARTTRR